MTALTRLFANSNSPSKNGRQVDSTCATGSASAELPADANFERHWQSQWHTISTGC
jgi:hypothetical protein